MTDSPPPPSPDPLKHTESQDVPETYSTSSSRSHPTVSSSAINRSLYYQFPTPPARSPRSPPYLSSHPITSPRSNASLSRRLQRGRNESRIPSASSTDTSRRSSLTPGLRVIQPVEIEYGPPPHPAPTTPLPPIPGAPRVPFTTPAQERNWSLSYELYDKLLPLEKQRKEKDVN